MKYFTTSILLILSIQAYGQFTKGDKVLGGEFNFGIKHTPKSQNSVADFKSTSFGISPQFGVFISNNIELGGYFSYSYGKNNITGIAPYVNESDSNSGSIGMYIKRYYRITDKFLFTLGGDISYGLGISNRRTIDQWTGKPIEVKSKDNYIGIKATPGFSFFPTENWAFQLSIGNIGYGIKKDLESDLKEYNFDVNYGTIGLGVSYFFRKRAKE